jgi:hypothetical protein
MQNWIKKGKIEVKTQSKEARPNLAHATQGTWRMPCASRGTCHNKEWHQPLLHMLPTIPF